MYKVSFGDKLFLFFVFVYYVFPSAYNIVSPTSINERLDGDPSWLAGLLASLLFVVSFLLVKIFCFNPGSWREMQISREVPWVFSRHARWFMMALFLPIAIKFSIDFSANFRHQQAFSSSGYIPLVYYILRSYHILTLLICMSSRYKSGGDPVYCFVLAICIFITMSASFDAVVLVACAYAVLKQENKSFFNLVRRLFGSKIILLSVPFLLLVVSQITKTGSAESVFLGVEYVLWAADILMTRLSYHSYHFAHFIANPEIWFDYWPAATEILFDQTVRRLYILFGIDYPSETYQTVSRLNFVVFDPHSSMLAGSSPGVFASFIYLPFGPILLPVLIFFVAYVLSRFDRLMGAGHYEWPVYCLALYILNGIISSPMDTLNFFSVSFFSFFLLLMSSLRIRFRINEKEPGR